MVIGLREERMVGLVLGGCGFCISARIGLGLEKAPSLGIATSSQIAKQLEILMLRWFRKL